MTKVFIDILKKGGVGVMPTDTIYGILARAHNKKAVERIYKIKGRDEKKPFIILISSLKDLEKFGIKIPTSNLLKKFWPGPVSIILEHTNKKSAKKFKYLNRGGGSLAFRFPKKKFIISFLEKTGPLVAPSANPEGLPPAQNAKEAQKYFGEKVDFYLSSGKPKMRPSKIILIDKSGNINILRK
jgi:L-threonylcarbamoyladenylate synthase